MTNTLDAYEDVISSILGDEPGAAIIAIRQQFPQNQADFQAYYDALFVPTDASLQNLSLAIRYLVAIRTATHTLSESVLCWYIQQAEALGVSDTEIGIAQNLEVVSTDDPTLDAIYAHVDLLVKHPVDASRDALDILGREGLSPAGIVTLSQIVAFVSYQIRFVAVLRAVGGIS